MDASKHSNRRSFISRNDRTGILIVGTDRPIPEWFVIGEQATPQVMRRIAEAVFANAMAFQVKSAPMLAYWFVLDTLLLANRANRDGMHANALALTRQCVETIGLIGLGFCGHPEAEAALLKRDSDRLNPGNLRAWLQANVWPRYGSGLWAEPWFTFMREFAAAVQPYAHYSRNLAQWQLRLHRLYDRGSPEADLKAIIEMRPRAYDPQKATRTTLFHALLHYTLGRVWIAANREHAEFAVLIKSATNRARRISILRWPSNRLEPTILGDGVGEGWRSLARINPITLLNPCGFSGKTATSFAPSCQ